jgi:hypothetical protein
MVRTGLVVVAALSALVVAASSGATGQATRVHVVRPFNGLHIAAAYRVARTVRGFCTDSSWQDMGRSDGWRCGWSNGWSNYIGDPCFSGRRPVQYVLCPADPLRERKVVVKLRLSKPLPTREAHKRLGRIWPWAVRLAGGERCISTAAVAGSDFRGRRINYACRPDGLIVGYVDRKTSGWTVLFASNPKARLTRVRVTDAYW